MLSYFSYLIRNYKRSKDELRAAQLPDLMHFAPHSTRVRNPRDTYCLKPDDDNSAYPCFSPPLAEAPVAAAAS